MTTELKHDVARIASQFQLDGDFIEAVPYGTGHINDTYASLIKTADGKKRFIHQRINQNVFQKPAELMENIARVTEHQHKKIIAAGGDPARESLTIIKTIDGANFLLDEKADFWRTYIFIEGASTYDQVEKIEHVYNAAGAFGRFLKDVSDLPGGRLHETIPDFHNTRRRFDNFLSELGKDVKNRAKDVKPEIDFVLSREADTSVLLNLVAEGKCPQRITHNDTKLNNVMIDNATDAGLCVIDLDTVMPGLPGYDFGDLVRTGANPATEDEKDLGKIRLDIEMFERIAGGFLKTAREFLSPVEIEYLVFAAKLMIFENCIRFLTDHLAGDVYFKIHRQGHNLDRNRTQMTMVRDMENKMGRLQAIVLKYAKK